MLLINAKENQRILIGDETRVEVLNINKNLYETTFELTREGVNKQFTLKAGSSEQILPRVTMTLTRIFVGNTVVAAIGFNAPLDIKIRGDWFNKKGNNHAA